MNKEVFVGKTYEEAKNNALEALNASEAEVVIVEKETKKALFNKKCEIEVTLISELNKNIKEFLIELVKNMGANANIEIKSREESTTFNIVTNESAILIGKNGRTIEAIQVIAKQKVNTDLGIFYKFIVDVNDYKAKRKVRLEKLAKYTAKSVAKTKIEVKLDPMNSYERRIIHNALANSKDVITKSDGEEPNRAVVIKPKED